MDTVSVDARFNNRNSDRIIGGSAIINEGWGSYRGTRMTDVYAQGLRLVDATTPGHNSSRTPTPEQLRMALPTAPG